MALFRQEPKSTLPTSQLQSVPVPNATAALILPVGSSPAMMSPTVSEQTVGLIAAKALDGAVLRGTYYNKVVEGVMNRSTYVGDTTHDTSVRAAHHKYLNFEAKASSAFEYQWDEAKGVYTYVADIKTYPGFTPRLGDVFLLQMEDCIAAFRVSAATPPTWRTNHVFNVRMFWDRTLSNEQLAALDDSVTEEMYFDLNTLLRYKTTLTTTAQRTVERLEARIPDLVRHIYRHYYNHSIRSYVRPDGIYDPMVITFLQRTISLSLFKERPPSQLLPMFDPGKFDESIFGALLSASDTLEDVRTSYVIRSCQPSTRSANITALAGSSYLALTTYGDHADGQHVISDVLASTGKAHTALEHLLLEFFETRTVRDIETLDAVVQTYATLPPLEQFYTTIILPWMIAVAVNGLRIGG